MNLTIRCVNIRQTLSEHFTNVCQKKHSISTQFGSEKDRRAAGALRKAQRVVEEHRDRHRADLRPAEVRALGYGG